jgi:hypothetical protein
MTTKNPVPATLVECPLCDGPLALEPDGTTVECPACRVRMDLVPMRRPIDSTARQRLASAA